MNKDGERIDLQHNDSIEALFEEAAQVLEDDEVSPVKSSTLSSAGKTP